MRNIYALNGELTQPQILMAESKSLKVKPFDVTSVNYQYLPDLAPAKIPERWSIAAMASPTYYSSLGSGNSDTKQLMATEQPVVSYSGGFAVSYKLNKRLSIQTGLYYSSLGQQIDDVSSFSGFKQFNNAKGGHSFEVLTTNGAVYINNPDVFLIGTGSTDRILTAYNNDVFDPKKASLQYINNTIIQSFSYLELPVVLRYKLIDKAVDLNLIGGLSYGQLVNNSVYARSEGNKIALASTDGLNHYTISSSIGMGMEYNISNKFSLNLEPTFRYYLNPFNEGFGVKQHPYSIGLFSGISYKF